MDKWIYGFFIFWVIFAAVGQIYFYDFSVNVLAVVGILVFIFIGIAGKVEPKHLNDKHKKD